MIFTVLCFLLPVSVTINMKMHPVSGSLQVWSIAVSVKGKEPSAVPKSLGFLSPFLKLHFHRQQNI